MLNASAFGASGAGDCDAVVDRFLMAARRSFYTQAVKVSSYEPSIR
jgi:hypothetical protein